MELKYIATVYVTSDSTLRPILVETSQILLKIDI